MLKILISDSLADQGVDVLERAPGIEVLNKPGLSPEELLECHNISAALSGSQVTRAYQHVQRLADGDAADVKCF